MGLNKTSLKKWEYIDDFKEDHPCSFAYLKPGEFTKIDMEFGPEVTHYDGYLTGNPVAVAIEKGRNKSRYKDDQKYSEIPDLKNKKYRRVVNELKRFDENNGDIHMLINYTKNAKSDIGPSLGYIYLKSIQAVAKRDGINAPVQSLFRKYINDDIDDEDGISEDGILYNISENIFSNV